MSETFDRIIREASVVTPRGVAQVDVALSGGTIALLLPRGQMPLNIFEPRYLAMIDDALRSGIITTDDLPKECIRVLGDTHKKRIDTLVRDMIENSFEKPQAKLSEEKTQAMNELRSYMFQNVYLNQNVKKAEDLSKVRTIITVLFTYFSEHPDQLPEELAAMRGEFPDEELAKDHVAGMTDRYAVSLYEKLF